MSTPARSLAAKDVHRVACPRRPTSANAPRQQTIVLLSFRAGLRAAEIAGLDWSMVLDATGCVGHSLLSHGQDRQCGRARRLPLHPGTRNHASRLIENAAEPEEALSIRSQRGGALCARSVVNWSSQGCIAISDMTAAHRTRAGARSSLKRRGWSPG